MIKIDGARSETEQVSLNGECLWARQLWLQARSKKWDSSLFSLSADRESWAADQLSERERQLMIDSLAVLHAVAPCIERSSIALYRALTDRSCQCFLLQQACQAANHVDMVMYCCDELGIEQQAVGVIPRDIAAILTPLMHDRELTSVDELVRSLAEQHLLAGVMVCSTMLLLCYEQGLMPRFNGVASLFNHVLHDLVQQHEFCCDLINALKANAPNVWNTTQEAELVDVGKECVAVLRGYLHQVCCPGSFDRACQQLYCLADYTCERVDLVRLYGSQGYPSWMESTGFVGPQADIACDEVKAASRLSSVKVQQQEQQ